MKSIKYILVILLFAFTNLALAEDSEDQAIEKKDRPAWHEAIQKEYSYTDEQMKTLTDSGLNYTQISKVANLSAKSEKPLDEVLKMRTDQKMGWGEIAKSIGVHPSEIGKGTAKLRKKVKENRSERREAKKDKRAERKEARKDRKAEKREKRMARKAEKMERKAERRANRAEKKANRKGR